MSDFVDFANTPESVERPVIPYTVPAGKYAILFLKQNPDVSNYSYYVAYNAGDEIASIGNATNYLIKVYDLP